MKITIIADNYVDTACLVAEHGFSCLVETENRKILFDTGQGAALLNNMQTLGVSKDLDMIVFSHGHYDHTGGLSKYLDELSEYSGHIYASKKIFDSHLKKDGDSYKEVGFEAARADVEKRYTLHLNDRLTEISENIFLSGPVKRFQQFDADAMLYNGDKLKDMFVDEQYMAVKVPEGIHIITGCTHCGMINLVKDALEKFPGEKILSLTGGLHLFRATKEQTEEVIDFIKDLDIGVLNTGHCTGLDASMQMKQVLGGRMNITKTGLVLSL